jgi:hypothetical protein
MGQYGSHSCRSGDAGAVATTTSASAPKQAIVISTLTGRKIRLVERVDNVVGPLTQNRRATGSWSRGVYDMPVYPSSVSVAPTSIARFVGRGEHVYPCGHECNEGDAQWNALDARYKRGEWQPVCRLCVVPAIARGEVALDRRSAHETLAYMLGGQDGLDAYRAYFYFRDAANAR